MTVMGRVPPVRHVLIAGPPVGLVVEAPRQPSRQSTPMFAAKQSNAIGAARKGIAKLKKLAAELYRLASTAGSSTANQGAARTISLGAHQQERPLPTTMRESTGPLAAVLVASPKISLVVSTAESKSPMAALLQPLRLLGTVEGSLAHRPLLLIQSLVRNSILIAGALAALPLQSRMIFLSVLSRFAPLGL